MDSSKLRVSVVTSVALAAVLGWTQPVRGVPAAEGLPPVGSAGGPSRELSAAEEESWLAGRDLFVRAWTEKEGLGSPGFNAESCATCHSDPATGGSGSNEFNVIVQFGGSHYSSGSKGTTSSKRPGNQLTLMRQLRDKLAEQSPELVDRVFAEIQTPTLLGLGRVESISDEAIVANEDPRDENGDGIRGRANRVEVDGTTEIGRYGWRAEVPRLADFVCMALAGELGLTAHERGRGFGEANDEDEAADPEIGKQEFDDLSFYVAHLAAPPRAASKTPRAAAGERFFENVGCAKCHIPTLRGSQGDVELYSDLLLHEIRIEKTKTKRGTRTNKQTLRTPLLIGVSKTAPYLHDGSADTLEAAVLAHDGEAAASREAYQALIEGERKELLEFLETL